MCANLTNYLVPMYISIIPNRIKSKSNSFVFRFFSLNSRAPAIKDIITLLRRINETIDIMPPSDSA